MWIHRTTHRRQHERFLRFAVDPQRRGAMRVEEEGRVSELTGGDLICGETLAAGAIVGMGADSWSEERGPRTREIESIHVLTANDAKDANGRDDESDKERDRQNCRAGGGRHAQGAPCIAARSAGIDVSGTPGP